ncbi:hypothetical protein BHE74_00052382 [Ensete ventricosum]|nr:hypothetical protein BHE74_00052382 [Ensete ventricosum]
MLEIFVTHFRPDRYVPLFGEWTYDSAKWRASVPFIEQLQAFQELIDEGKVIFPDKRQVADTRTACYRAVSPKIDRRQSIEGEIVRRRSIEGEKGKKKKRKRRKEEYLFSRVILTGAPSLPTGRHCNGMSPRTGRKVEATSLLPHYLQAIRTNHFFGHAVPYFILQVATEKYIELAKKHGLSPVQLALGFVRDRPFMTSTIIGSTSMDQLKEDIDAFSTAPRPLPSEVVDEIDRIFKIYKDPAIV